MNHKITMKDRNVTRDDLYNYYIHKNMSINKISQTLNVDKQVVKRWLVESDIKINYDKNCQKYNFDKHYFDIIDTEEKAYWLGFIWCDGYVCKRERGENKRISYDFKLSLSEKDIEHLEKLKQALNSEHKIKKYKITNGFPTKNQEVRLYISNKYFGEILYNKYGLIPHRHDISKLLKYIPKEYYRDFVRGVIDAEGSINCKSIEFLKTSREEFSLGISTYKELLIFINNALIENNLTKTNYKLTKRHLNNDGNCESLRITGNNIIYNILKWVYEGSNTYLNRKYNDFIHIQNYRSNYIKEKGGINNGKGKIIYTW